MRHGRAKPLRLKSGATLARRRAYSLNELSMPAVFGQPGEVKKMVGWDGIEPPTPGFSGECLPSCKYAQMLEVERWGPNDLMRWNVLE
jgi:hypothetical protein